jgi:MFS family permease
MRTCFYREGDSAPDRGGGTTAFFTRDKLIVLAFLTGAHFVTHVMLVAYNAIALEVGDEFGLETKAQLLSPITFTLFIYGAVAVGSGYLADRYNPLKILTIGMVLASAASFAIALSPNYWVLVASFSLLGAGLGFYHPTGLSFISKVFGPKHRGKALGINGIGGNSGWLISPIATAAIAVSFGWRVAYMLWGSLGLVFVLLVLYLFGTGIMGSGKEEATVEVKKRNGRRNDRRNGVVDLKGMATEETVAPTSSKDYTASLAKMLTFSAILVMLITVVRGFYFHGTTDTLPTFLNLEKGGLLVVTDSTGRLVVAGGFLSILYLMGVVAEPLGGWIKDRYSARPPIVIASLLNAGSLVLLIYAESTIMLIIFVASFGFCFLLLMSVINALIADVTPPQVRGTFYGLTFLTRDGIGAFAPLFVGLVADVSGRFENAYWVLVFIAVATGLLGLGISKQKAAVQGEE